jgi:uncharacterized protein YdeI (YjbR/CyaY-like superfamily)
VAPDVHRFGKKKRSWISTMASLRRSIPDAYLNESTKGIKAGKTGHMK